MALPIEPHEVADLLAMNVLVVDVGGTHVKCATPEHNTPVKFRSGPKLTAERMVKNVLRITKDWRFVAISIGYPGVIRRGMMRRGPKSAGPLREAIGTSPAAGEVVA
jgi:polyphosphate glucokinase